MDLLKNTAYQREAEELIAQQFTGKTGLHRVDPALDDRLEERLQTILEMGGDLVAKSSIHEMSGGVRSGVEENIAVPDGRAGSAVDAGVMSGGKKHFQRSRRRWVAAAAVIFLLGAGGYYWFGRNVDDGARMARVEPQKDGRKTAKYVRNIVLPDGSTVILKEGSTLTYPTRFEGKERVVELAGEAYFDIVTDQQRAFVIRTGKIRTTVLGTAFNIRAYPGQKEITVSVTKGKVKVEDPTKVLAVLTRDQQVVYSQTEELYRQQKVNAISVVTDWTKQDMAFEDNTFLAIAGILEKRYGVRISFSNPLLEQCTITASFDGTEPLEKVLAVLCQVRPAKYRISEDKVTIDGESCKETK